jgi:endonuclease YncB( thermonuclease family)
MVECDYKFVLISHGVGKYGRCLGTILFNDININKLLIKEGLAKEY